MMNAPDLNTDAPAIRDLIRLSLAEDLADGGDVTTRPLFSPSFRELDGEIEARETGILAGLPIVRAVFRAVDPGIRVEPLLEEGERFGPGDILGTVRGPARGMLEGERTALNFLQRLSGVATLTRRFVDAVEGTGARILDTRKTTPGYRLLEKYAVRMGGGTNHRLGLYDQVLLKDNHLALLQSGDEPVDLTTALRRLREANEEEIRIEVEVDRLDQIPAALAGEPDIILLDNMGPETLEKAIERVRTDARGEGVALEASGGITLETVRAVAETGVDRISVGALTHSSRALDIALEVR